MPTYANRTEVTSEKSRAEIERTLTRYGATSFAYGWDPKQAAIQFQAHGRMIRFLLPLPDRELFRRTPVTREFRSDAAWENAYEQAIRQRWRALALVIKAKLEAVEAGIAEFEEEFLAYVLLPDGRTVGEFIRPQIDESYRSGLMPSSLPALPSPSDVG